MSTRRLESGGQQLGARGWGVGSRGGSRPPACRTPASIVSHTSQRHGMYAPPADDPKSHDESKSRFIVAARAWKSGLVATMSVFPHRGFFKAIIRGTCRASGHHQRTRCRAKAADDAGPGPRDALQEKRGGKAPRSKKLRADAQQQVNPAQAEQHIRRPGGDDRRELAQVSHGLEEA